ncbi:hypothetical protein RchiOBHm_Chr6g0280041 [Rosa chinensis]|uniref:Uncharacterized protein n=1 Tax=Rosa chinensis TaxID=74649 RepID=A0A2P6PT47_ROSCH|nr:hypothetical protein RchiOBHm_Chr6g0280041 [Rosa chinensis]
MHCLLLFFGYSYALHAFLYCKTCIVLLYTYLLLFLDRGLL